ncbi:hypothetical protein C2845_PM10G10210 [Panicum miliaceum]|uniref:DUF1618 domain-containing protein n=1 Tax=Panicum miliaceum TaxID=4540 RepID=A0A3L6PHA2_PANMI|nr:hypothetical protein C2845_PM10G10210 [Panicum miliaceum]
MAGTPWVFLSRVIRAEPAAAAAAAAPDFTLPIALPPRLTILAAGRGAHPDPNHPDRNPYIIAAGPLCLLAHFAVAPSMGTTFEDNPHDTRLAVGDYIIAELQVRKGSDHATLVSFEWDQQAWYSEDVESPFAEEDRDREWAPHGAVCVETTLWWFDLSWGILSCDLAGDHDLLFHRLPDDRALPMATPLMLTQRCIAVEVIVPEVGGDDDDSGDDSEAARVCMWTMTFGPDGWRWEANYSVGFPKIWDDASYRETGLPRDVPIVAAVCPTDPNLVYFTLKRNIFGVNVANHRVVGNEVYDEKVNNARLDATQASVRYVLPWYLPPGLAPGAAGHDS